MIDHRSRFTDADFVTMGDELDGLADWRRRRAGWAATIAAQQADRQARRMRAVAALLTLFVAFYSIHHYTRGPAMHGNKTPTEILHMIDSGEFDTLLRVDRTALDRERIRLENLLARLTTATARLDQELAHRQAIADRVADPQRHR